MLERFYIYKYIHIILLGNDPGSLRRSWEMWPTPGLLGLASSLYNPTCLRGRKWMGEGLSLNQCSVTVKSESANFLHLIQKETRDTGVLY